MHVVGIQVWRQSSFVYFIYVLMFTIDEESSLSFSCKYEFGIIISEGIIDYALNVMLLVQYDSRRVVIVSSWGDV